MANTSTIDQVGCLTDNGNATNKTSLNSTFQLPNPSRHARGTLDENNTPRIPGTPFRPKDTNFVANFKRPMQSIIKRTALAKGSDKLPKRPQSITRALKSAKTPQDKSDDGTKQLNIDSAQVQAWLHKPFREGQRVFLNLTPNYWRQEIRASVLQQWMNIISAFVLIKAPTHNIPSDSQVTDPPAYGTSIEYTRHYINRSLLISAHTRKTSTHYQTYFDLWKDYTSRLPTTPPARLAIEHTHHLAALRQYRQKHHAQLTRADLRVLGKRKRINELGDVAERSLLQHQGKRGRVNSAYCVEHAVGKAFHAYAKARKHERYLLAIARLADEGLEREDGRKGPKKRWKEGDKGWTGLEAEDVGSGIPDAESRRRKRRRFGLHAREAGACDDGMLRPIRQCAWRQDNRTLRFGKK